TSPPGEDRPAAGRIAVRRSATRGERALAAAGGLRISLGGARRNGALYLVLGLSVRLYRGDARPRLARQPSDLERRRLRDRAAGLRPIPLGSRVRVDRGERRNVPRAARPDVHVRPVDAVDRVLLPGRGL